MPIAIPVSKLLALANPLATNPWGARPKPSRKGIEQAIAQRRFQTIPITGPLPARYHVERIAFLIEYGWSDPISIDVGVPGFNCPTWVVEDGNHRLAAAAYRQDQYIAGEVSGSLARALEWLGIPVREPIPPYSIEQLAEMGYTAWRLLPNGDLAAVSRMTFNNGRLFAGLNLYGYEDCWCFDSYEKAWQALWNWDTATTTEPTGWKRHPNSGRRREKGDPSTEYVAR